MKIGAYTDKGKIREINEDNFFVSDFSNQLNGGFCIIADGMGGHNAGEVASRIAIEEIRAYILQYYQSNMSDKEIIEMLKSSMEKANEIIYNKAVENTDCSGMGTTCIICLMHHSYLYIAHVGDSRVYLIRDGDMVQITTDHSIVEELVNSGSITREEAQKHPQKNVITRALGGEKDVEIDIYIQECVRGDKFLICTDGLTNMLANDEILSVINSYNDLQLAVEKLIFLANDKGGLDNITAIVLNV